VVLEKEGRFAHETDVDITRKMHYHQIEFDIVKLFKPNQTFALCEAIVMEDLGSRIRDERLRQELTLDDLSQKTGLSKGFLSQVERGLAQPSVGSLKRIARQLGISMVHFFTPQNSNRDRSFLRNERETDLSYAEDVHVVRADRRKSLGFPGSGVTYDLLTPDLNRRIEVLYGRIGPGELSGDGPIIDPPGEKFGLVLKGILEVRVGAEVYRLEAGDSIYFPTHHPHSWRGLEGDPIEVIWVMTPPSF